MGWVRVRKTDRAAVAFPQEAHHQGQHLHVLLVSKRRPGQLGHLLLLCRQQLGRRCRDAFYDVVVLLHDDVAAEDGVTHLLVLARQGHAHLAVAAGVANGLHEEGRGQLIAVGLLLLKRRLFLHLGAQQICVLVVLVLVLLVSSASSSAAARALLLIVHGRLHVSVTECIIAVLVPALGTHALNLRLRAHRARLIGVRLTWYEAGLVSVASAHFCSSSQR